jgi:Uncharacterized conserved protein
MLFTYTYKIKTPEIQPDKRKAYYQAKKMLPEYVFDTSQLENNPITFPEVQTLMDGVTIGGHKISDVQQVLNIKDAWFHILDSIKSDTFTISKDTFNTVHSFIAREEALEWGKFRNGSVGIAGTTKYKSPAWQELSNIFDTELQTIIDTDNFVESALRLFLWGALNQFYWDGNKRTSRIMASGMLINAGYGVFNIKAKDILTFNTLMVDFYETQIADDIMKFLAENCIKYI